MPLRLSLPRRPALKLITSTLRRLTSSLALCSEPPSSIDSVRLNPSPGSVKLRTQQNQVHDHSVIAHQHRNQHRDVICMRFRNMMFVISCQPTVWHSIGRNAMSTRHSAVTGTSVASRPECMHGRRGVQPASAPEVCLCVLFARQLRSIVVVGSEREPLHTGSASDPG